MNNLKITLPFELIIITIIYSFIIITNHIYFTKYKVQDAKIIGIIDQIKITDEKITLIVKAKEKIIATYYKSKEEKINITKGQTIMIKGQLRIPPANTTFNLFNYQNYLLSKKIYWMCNIDNYTIINNNIAFSYKIKNYIDNKIAKTTKSKNYIQAFIIGENNLDEHVNQSYQINGISHLFSVSGMHVTLIAITVLTILKKVSKNNLLNKFIVIIILLFYLFLNCFKAPIIRATLLFILLSINKKVTALNYLIIIACVMILYNPYYIYDLGFKFSFIISFYLILFKNIINSYQNYFKKIWIISFIAFLTSIPIMINNFFMINLLSPFLNLIFVPMISLIIFPLAVLTFFLPSLDNLLFSLITILEQLSLFFKQITLFNITLAKIPFVLLVIYYIIITFCLYNYLHKQYLIILIIVIFIHSRLAYFNNNYEIISLDVGQGDSTLIKFPHNDMNILIDTGGNMFKTNKTIIKNTTIPYLKSLGITKLNYLFLTHGDYDHMGESRELIKNFPVKYVFMNKGNNNKIEKKFIKLLDFNHIKYEQISKKNIEIDNDQIMFINKSNSKNENEDSLITYMNLNNKNILLMGDASKNNEKYILKEYNLPNMDILKIGHHGSKNSTSKQLLKKVKPQYAIISVGLNNHYYHPHKKVIALLKKHKVIIYKTSTQGSIKFILKKNIKVITCRHGAR